MTKPDYLDALERRLVQLPPAERETQLAYYGELFDDMTEDGLSPDEAAARLGAPEALAAEILQSQPLPALMKSRLRPRGGWTALRIVLLVLGSPVWLPLLLAAAVVVLTLYAVLWVVAAAVAVCALALGVCCVAAALCWLLNVLTAPASAAMLLSGALAGAGLAILLGYAVYYAVRGALMLAAALGRALRSLFIRKETL